MDVSRERTTPPLAETETRMGKNGAGSALTRVFFYKKSSLIPLEDRVKSASAPECHEINARARDRRVPQIASFTLLARR